MSCYVAQTDLKYIIFPPQPWMLELQACVDILSYIKLLITGIIRESIISVRESMGHEIDIYPNFHVYNMV